MVQWNSRGIRKGMVIPLNLTVSKVTERDGIRSFHLNTNPNDLPPGFEMRDIVLRVPATQQDVTLEEANSQ